MFEFKAFTGGALTQQWAEERARWEPLFEVIQTKGQSESHPSLSPTDEFAVNYELWDRGNLNLVPKQPGMIQYEYLREALKNGLRIEQQLGANPFKYGLVSGSDADTGLTAVEEDNFFCKFVSCEPRLDRWNEDAMKLGEGWEITAASYTGVWATENTREALWDAMKRKETYSTSGTRMIVRFFGGFDFEPKDAQTRNPAEVGYEKGCRWAATCVAPRRLGRRPFSLLLNREHRYAFPNIEGSYADLTYQALQHSNDPGMSAGTQWATGGRCRDLPVRVGRGADIRSAAPGLSVH